MIKFGVYRHCCGAEEIEAVVCRTGCGKKRKVFMMLFFLTKLRTLNLWVLLNNGTVSA